MIKNEIINFIYWILFWGKTMTFYKTDNIENGYKKCKTNK